MPRCCTQKHEAKLHTNHMYDKNEKAKTEGLSEMCNILRAGYCKSNLEHIQK